MIEIAAVTCILAAWSLPVLFLLIVASLMTYAVLRPLYLAWEALLRAVAAPVRAVGADFAEHVAVRSHAYAVKHRHGA
jgi:hypothetical protein